MESKLEKRIFMISQISADTMPDTIRDTASKGKVTATDSSISPDTDTSRDTTRRRHSTSFRLN